MNELPVEVFNLSIIAGCGLIAFIFSFLVFKAIELLFKIHLPSIKSSKKIKVSLRFLFVVIGINIGMSFAKLPNTFDIFLHKVSHVALIISFTYVLICLAHFIKELLYLKFDITIKNNLEGRKARTQIDFLHKLTIVIIMLIGVSVVLMSFSRVREFGTSLLASAGIAGVLIGLAAQKSISNLLAGFQIAFTQPIRLDDIVIVEGEWGKIEEITLTYVVVKIWDLRRLIIPISYFLEKPFQNWTRTSADILGTVFIYTDYTIPIDELRKELKRILLHEGKDYWDGNVGAIQVTNTSEKGVELRILVSSTNADYSWDLRCLVREQIITFIQKNYPDSLPRIRLTQGLVSETA